MQEPNSFNDIAIISIEESDCIIYFWYMSKDDAINIMKNTELNEKVECYKFFHYI